MFRIIEKLFGWLYPLLKKWHLNDTIASYLSVAINIIVMSIVAYLIYLFSKKVFVSVLVFTAKKSRTKLDDLLVSNQTAKYIAHLIPFLFIYKSVPYILSDFVYWEGVFGKLVEIYIIFLLLWIVRSILKAVRDYLKQKEAYSDKPIDSFIQVIMIVLWLFGVIIIISEIFGITTNALLGTLGAISAIIILIFRDTILGFVASVQVSLNDMVRIGDWITFDKFGADGDVIEINLATVKVRNFDYTTTTIPTYSLISDSFRNWRGMHDSAGRRIKRHLLIKAKSIRFLQENDLENLKLIQLIENYIILRQNEIQIFNKKNNVNKALEINGRNLTNFGVFRKYITTYLENYPGLNKDMIILCRQLQPSAQGIPLEIYAFSKDQKFENYEYIMSDIFDHIIASIKYFDLEIFENTTEFIAKSGT